jgi:hypothetical protein
MMSTNNILRFAPLGFGSCTDDLSYRMRTSFIDDKGRSVFIELSGTDNHKYLPPKMQALPFEIIGYVNEVELCVDGVLQGITPDLFPIRAEHFNYTRYGILKFINKLFGKAYSQIDISYVGDVFADKEIIS